MPVRINKRQRRKHRKSAKFLAEWAERCQADRPRLAAFLREFAADRAKAGAPPKSKRGRGKADTTRLAALVREFAADLAKAGAPAKSKRGRGKK